MRKVAAVIFGCMALSVGTVATAQDFPKKNIEFIIPLSPGGGFDTYVRAVAPVMERQLPNAVSIVPTNVPAAGGARGAAQVYRARPDGYTIGIFNIPGMLVPQIRGDGGVQYDLKKLTWLGSFGRDTFGIAVAKDTPYKTVADLRALGRPVKFTASGPSSTAHAATLIAADLLGIKREIITAYKGSNDYVLAVVRGDGDAAISTLPVLEKFAESGELRIIGTFEETSSIPGAQSAPEMGHAELSNLSVHRLIAGPPGLSPSIARTLSDSLMAAMKDPALINWSKQSGIDLEPGDAESARKTLEEQFKFYERYDQYLGPAN